MRISTFFSCSQQMFFNKVMHLHARKTVRRVVSELRGITSKPYCLLRWFQKSIDSETWEKVSFDAYFSFGLKTITLVLSLLNINKRCDKYRISRISVLWSLRQRHRQVRLKTRSRKWRKAHQTLGVGRIQRRWKHHNCMTCTLLQLRGCCTKLWHPKFHC